ncbi:MAG: hypothetical protein PW790_07760 [Parvibaculaceae bacterium]|nr:hypothetical protein [Parvibaculaceae bacterium]
MFDMETGTTSREYDRNGKVVSRRDYKSTGITPYIEHGLTDDLTLVGRISWLKQSIDTPGAPSSSAKLTELEAGLRYHVFTISGFLVSIQPGLIFHRASTNNSPHTDKETALDKEIALMVGRGFSLFGLPTFISLEGNYIFQDHDRPDEVDGDMTLGFALSDKTFFIVRSLNSTSLGTYPLAPSRVTSSRIGFQLVQRIHPQFSIGGGITQSIAGQNTTKDTLFGLTLWYHL